jgi:site-specific recombinase XerD
MARRPSDGDDPVCGARWDLRALSEIFLKVKPSRIQIERLDVPLILAFLEHLERKRGNSPRTRNTRLAAINAFFRFLEYRVPILLDQARRVHAIPMKKIDQALVAYLARDELQALLDAPDGKTGSETEQCYILRSRRACACRSWWSFASIRSIARG